MGVGELYGLFACMVTRRSWKSVTGGIGKSKMNESEKDELRMYASSLIPQISEVLARMPREMLLILKTNDLMRNIEHKLGVFGSSDGHIEVSLKLSGVFAVILKKIYVLDYWSFCRFYRDSKNMYFRCPDASSEVRTILPFAVQIVYSENSKLDSTCIGRL